MSLISEKASELAQEYGYKTAVELANDYAFSGCVPAICMNPGCSATYEYEPDSDRGWCEECETNSVKSVMSLIGVI